MIWDKDKVWLFFEPVFKEGDEYHADIGYTKMGTFVKLQLFFDSDSAIEGNIEWSR